MTEKKTIKLKNTTGVVTLEWKVGDYDPVDLHCPVCKAKQKGGLSADGRSRSCMGSHSESPFDNKEPGINDFTYRCPSCRSEWTEHWIETNRVDWKNRKETMKKVTIDKVRPDPPKPPKKYMPHKYECPKCGKKEVIMTWRPTMLENDMALINECEACHYRPNPGPDSGAWGFGGGPVPIHYGNPPHDIRLTNIRFKCDICKLACERHELELPSEIMKIGTPVYWECPKCKSRIGLRQMLAIINKEDEP